MTNYDCVIIIIFIIFNQSINQPECHHQNNNDDHHKNDDHDPHPHHADQNKVFRSAVQRPAGSRCSSTA